MAWNNVDEGLILKYHAKVVTLLVLTGSTILSMPGCAPRDQLAGCTREVGNHFFYKYTECYTRNYSIIH